jgi:hypothetical protein
MMAAGLIMREMGSVGRDVGDHVSEFARSLIFESNTLSPIQSFVHFG